MGQTQHGLNVYACEKRNSLIRDVQPTDAEAPQCLQVAHRLQGAQIEHRIADVQCVQVAQDSQASDNTAAPELSILNMDLQRATFECNAVL